MQGRMQGLLFYTSNVVNLGSSSISAGTHLFLLFKVFYEVVMSM